MNRVAWLANDNLLEVDKVKNQATGAFINDATVTVTVKDTDGDEVSGETWPLSLSYIAGSDGKYQGTLADTISFSKDTVYVAEVTINGGAGLLAFVKLRFEVRERTANL